MWVVKIGSVLVYVPEITGTQCLDHITSVLVSGHRNRLDTRVGIEIDMISVMGAKSTRFMSAGSKLTWLQCGDQNCRVLSRGQN